MRLFRPLLCLIFAASLLGHAVAADGITILAGNAEGMNSWIGRTLVPIFADNGIAATTRTSKGSLDSLERLQNGTADVAWSLGNSLTQAWSGNSEAGFRGRHDQLRTLTAFYPHYIQIIASKQSGIRSLLDLKGKRMSLGARRSGTELSARAVFAAANLTYNDLSVAAYLPARIAARQLAEGTLDAIVVSGAIGLPTIRDLARTTEIVMIDIPATTIARMGAPFTEGRIAADSYEGQTAAVTTARVQTYLVTRAGLPEPLAYHMTRAIFQNLDALRAAQPAGTAVKLLDAPGVPPVPLHPGAARYFIDQGIAF